MAAKQLNVTLERVGSHSVTLDHIPPDYGLGISREECFGYFRSEWRGEAVMVTMSCDRYRGGSDQPMTAWRIYASAARIIDTTDDSPYPRSLGNVSDTARMRLSDACKPIMEAWLGSVDYTDSRVGAFTWAFRKCAQDMGRYAEPPSKDLRAMLTTFERESDPATVDRFTRAADIWDLFVSLIDC